VRAAAALLLALAACGPGIPSPDQPDPGDPDASPPGTPDAAPPEPDAAGTLGPWHLIWNDEFDGDPGVRPDQNKWRAEIGTDWGNQQLEYDTDSTSNAALDGSGHLIITARRENAGGQNYTSARLSSHGHLDRLYGRFEARMKLPRGQGMWPAFWMLGNNVSSVGWPNCGEIDIMENRGQQMSVIRGSLHGPGYSGGANHGRETDVGADLGNDYHTYIIEWDPDRVIWKVDNKVYFTATPSDLPVGKVWVYDHPFYIILNVAVGGNFVGDPSGATQFPQQMFVDYVRVYERMQ
jgi:beta-glucanase (GH16 family)